MQPGWLLTVFRSGRRLPLKNSRLQVCSRGVYKVYLIDDYIEAGSVAEAVSLLAEKPQRQLIAGGTDLLIKMRDGILGKCRISQHPQH
jgi:hypothetical protein